MRSTHVFYINKSNNYAFNKSAKKKEYMWQIIGGLGLSLANRLISKGDSERAMRQQNQYEIQKMGLQAELNKQQAKYSQDLAKEMWEYTNYPNQIKMMKEAGLNPALMYGQGGGGGATTNGGQAAGVSMGSSSAVAMGLQLEQMRTQNQLTAAEVAKTLAETKKIEGVDTEGSKLDNEKKREEIDYLKQQGKLLLENIAGAKEDNKLKEFQNWLNDAKRKMRLDDESFAEALAGAEIREITARENIAWRDWRKAAIDDDFNARLANFMNTLVEGEVAKATEQIERAKQAKNDTDFQVWTQRQEKALSDALDELLEGAGKYDKILVAIAKWIFRSDSGAWKAKGGKK